MSETATETTSRIVWFDLPASDTAEAREFYSGLFGWSFEQFGDDDYHLSYDAGGAIVAESDRGLLAYFGVTDVEAAAARVRELGGDAGDIADIPNVGRYVKCVDPQGNAFGLYADGSS